LDIQLAGVTAQKGADIQHRMSVILWGQSGCGKTTLAATAPGGKLWINFDDNGTASVATRDDVTVLDLSASGDNVVTQFKDENSTAIKQLDKILSDHPEFETVVVDSVTSFGEKALAYGVRDASRSGATLEEPGFKGFGRKNTWTLRLVKSMLRLTAKHNRNIVFILHEDVGTKDSEGNLVRITLMVGSNLAQEIPVDFSEVWHVQDTGKAHLIRVRPDGYFRPMKTRMFKTDGPVRFEWKFNPETLEGEGIADWYARWRDNGYYKIDLPQQQATKKK
jgi:hypothetical protein